MTDERIIERLIKIFKLVMNKDIDLNKISPDSLIMTDLGVSSVGLVYLAIAIEEEFDIDMSDVTFNTFKTISDVISYIKKKVTE